ncbi:hypothetical protein WN944_015513 [Citrus x changshan-huyou]|uniref:TIR domain-containing protein n=1 Tax=Citrus x changshan-huyou TaxID=2935761 RepID=A0AAP0QLV3_9ROSI
MRYDAGRYVLETYGGFALIAVLTAWSRRFDDLFLSFRGEDTRDNFTSHLYSALCRQNIQTFIDDQLNRGDEISESLVNAIEASAVSVIVFSEGYASSRWCLDELVKILECKKEYAQIVIPVFYRVDPSDLVGVESRVEEIESLLGVQSKDVYALGIWGIGGIGKTTIARATFDKISSDFEGSCFLENVREDRHAFKQNHPEVGYEKFSSKVMKYAQGVPLALKVLGCFLYEREKEVWESAINKLQRILHPSILEGTEKIEGICLDMSKVKELRLNPNTFTKMPKLRFLKFYSSLFNGENKCKMSYLQDPGFAEVKYLHWHGYPLKSFPSNLSAEKLMLLEVPDNDIEQLWDCVKHYSKLNQIIHAACHKLIAKIPNPTLMPRLNKLVILNLRGSKSLKSLPSGIFNLEFLTKLDLSGCPKLKRLPEISSGLSSWGQCPTPFNTINFTFESLEGRDEKYLPTGPSRGVNGSSSPHKTSRGIEIDGIN